MKTILKDKSKIVAVGSRKTEHGQAGPGHDNCAWLKRFATMLIAHEPQKNIQIVDRTQPNHTIRKIGDLWDDDVLYEKPDYLLFLVGESEAFNTVQGSDISPEEYETIFRKLLDSAKKHLPDCSIVILDPYIASPWRSPYAFHGDACRALEKYTAVCRKMSEDYGTLHVATQDLVLRHLELRGAESLGPDPTNLNLQGHLLIARALADVLTDGKVKKPELKLQDGQTMVCIGDSITDAGRRQPHAAPMGYGYVRAFTDLQAVREPQKHIQFINRGIGGETLGNLHERWEADVMAHRPDWLSVKIGINDLNRHLTRPDFKKLCGPEKYRELFCNVLTRTRDTLPDCKILLIDPYLLSHAASEFSYWRRVMEILPKYHQVVREMSEKFKTLHIPTHQIFQQHMKYRSYKIFGNEPVHPTETGVMVIGEAVYKALSQ